MKKVHRVFLILISAVTGLTILLFVLFLFREPLLGPIIKKVAASSLENALGAGGTYSINTLEGSYVTNLDVHGVRLTPPEGSKIREITLDNLVVNYNPIEFMGKEPVSAIKSVFARGIVITLDPDAPGTGKEEVLGAGAERSGRPEPSQPREPEGRNEEPVPEPAQPRKPGDQLLSILRNVPEELFLDAEALIVILSDGKRYEIPVRAEGNTAAEIRIAMDIPPTLSPWAVPPLVFTSDSNSFILASRSPDETLGAEAREMPEIRISATAEATESGDGAVNRVEVSFVTEQIDVRLDATPRSISSVASLSSEGVGTVREMLRKFTGDLPAVGLGSINLQLDLETEPDAPDFFLEYLLENPLAGQEYLSGSGDLRARDWRYGNIPLGLINGNFEWHNDLLSIIGLRVEASGIFTVTADSLTLDPRKNLTPVNLEQLDVSIVDLVRFLELLQRGDVPFEDILGAGLSTSYLDDPSSDSRRIGNNAGSRIPADILTESGAGAEFKRYVRSAGKTLKYLLAGGIRQDYEAVQVQAEELPFKNLPFSVSTGNISIKDGRIVIGRFKAEAGKSFSLEVKNLTLDPEKKFAPTGLDAVSLVVNDAPALARLLLKKDIPALGFVSSGTLTAHREGSKLLLDTFSVKGKDLAASGDGDFEFIGTPQPALALNLSSLKAEIPRLSLTTAFTGSLDLMEYSGTVSITELGVSVKPDGNADTATDARLRGGAEASWDKAGFSAAVSELDAFGGKLTFRGENRERLSAEFDLAGISIQEVVSLMKSLDMKTGGLPNLTGTVSAKGSFSGNIRKTEGETVSPVFSVRFTTDGFTFERKPGSIIFEASQDENGLRFSEMNLDLNEYGSLRGDGLLPFTVGPGGVKLTSITDADFSLSGNLSSVHAFIPESSKEFIPDFTPELRLSIGSEPGTADLFLRVVDKNIRPSGPVTGTLPYGEFQIRASVSGFTTGTWKTSARIMTEQNTLLSGEITLRPGTGWTVLNLGERLMNGAIEGRARLYLPLERFATYIPRVQNLSGIIEGQISPSGTLKNPVLTGNLRIRDTSIRIDADIPSLDGLSGLVFFENNAFTVNSFDGFLGHAPFTVQGYIDLSRTMEIQEADLKFVGTNILVARSQDLRVRADAAVTVTGENNRLSVSGKIAVTDALYTKKIPLFSTSSAPSVGEGLQFFSIRGPLGERTDLDLRITAADTLTIDTNLYRGPFSLDLRIRGTAAVPVPTGRIFTDQGRVLLPFSTIDMQDVQIRFTQEDPFAPRIDVRGQTVMQNYNLHVNVTGNYPELEVNVTSSPPLDSDEAILLLATGNSSLNVFSAQGAISTTRTIGTYLGKEILQRLIGPGNPDESTFFDRLDIAIGQEISRAGQETITIEYRIGRSSPWYVIVERDRHDNFNAGVAWRLWFR